VPLPKSDNPERIKAKWALSLCFEHTDVRSSADVYDFEVRSRFLVLILVDRLSRLQLDMDDMEALDNLEADYHCAPDNTKCP
jgi:hypothetical protein